MANRIIAVVYTDDHDRDYVTGMDSEIYAQQTGGGVPLVGGAVAAANSTLPPLPRSVKPRKVKFAMPNGQLRFITALEPTAPLYVGSATQLQIENSDGVAATGERDGTVAEFFGRKRKQQPA